MNSRTIALAGGALLLALAGAMLLLQSKDQTSTEIDRRIQSTPQAAKGDVDGSITRPSEVSVGGNRGLPEEERAAILHKIGQASVTYSSTALPVIEPYLLDPDPQVRLAAMNGMIVLGEAAAGPLLRKAAENATSPKEAVALVEAADFVELPSGTFVPKDRTSPGTRKPADAEPMERSRLRRTPYAQPKEGSSAPVE